MSGGETGGAKWSGEKGDGNKKMEGGLKWDGKAGGQADKGVEGRKEGKSDEVCKGEARRAMEKREKELKQRTSDKKEDATMKPPPAKTSGDISPSQNRKRKE